MHSQNFEHKVVVFFCVLQPNRLKISISILQIIGYKKKEANLASFLFFQLIKNQSIIVIESIVSP
jgi:hypothetical protein